MTRLSYLLARRVNRSLNDPGSDGLDMFWPCLHLHTIDGLDHITPEFSPDLLLEAAAGLEAGHIFDKELALAAAVALRELAAPSRHPDITPQPIRALNVAVHYLAAKELEGKAILALQHVANAWSMPAATATDLNAAARADAARVLESIVANRLAHGGFASRADVLKALDQDMQWRAGASVVARPAPHKTKRKRASRKI